MDFGVSTAATLSGGEKLASDCIPRREHEWREQSVFATLSIGRVAPEATPGERKAQALPPG